MKIDLDKKIFLPILLFVSLIFILFYFSEQNILQHKASSESLAFFKNRFEKVLDNRYQKRKKLFLQEARELKKKSCGKIIYDYQNSFCDLSYGNPELCIEKKKIFLQKPICLSDKKAKRVVRGLYLNAWSASREDKIDFVISLAKEGKINAVVIDIKEVDGKTSFAFNPDSFGKIKPQSAGIIKEPKKLLERLKKEGIYTIGRIVLFKDLYLAEKYPDYAVKNIKNKKSLWRDYKNKAYLDPGAKDLWDYIVTLASESYKLGFDEINFDYIRFPSDGNMKEVYYPFSYLEIKKDPKWGRVKVLDNFSAYLEKSLRSKTPGIVISADVFGMVATNWDDLTIGQILESFLLYYDYVMPMSYPSHYPKGYLGLSNPDDYPYEIIQDSVKKAYAKIDSLNKIIEKEKKKAEGGNKKLLQKGIYLRDTLYSNKKLSGIQKLDKRQIRMWLQAFSCLWCKSYKLYDKEQIQAQKKAIYDLKGDSWILWSASSNYKNGWFEKEN